MKYGHFFENIHKNILDELFVVVTLFIEVIDHITSISFMLYKYDSINGFKYFDEW
jgi:hypothetical protein